MTHLLLLVLSAGAIYLSCELFVNAIEHLGRLLNVGALAVGTVLAAIGTALPESVVTGIAVTNGKTGELGIGAALGGPLALATIGYAVVGLALLARKQRVPQLDRRLGRDQIAFLGVFAATLVLGLVSFPGKHWCGLALFAGYAAYVVIELRAEDSSDEADLDPLRLGGSAAPRWTPVLVQTLVTLAVVFVASQVFVSQLEWAGPKLGLSAAVTALLLAPVATELPEVVNALIWVRQGKTHLALSNVSGSMMVQATVPSGLAIVFTPWAFDGSLLLSSLVTIGAVAFVLGVLLRGRLTAGPLAAAGGFYVLFAALLPFV